jgi:serine acetyltransferase
LVAVGDFRRAVRADIGANPRDPKARLVMFSFRLAQLMMGDLSRPRLVSLPFVIAHRFMTEFLLGIELRPKTRVGPGLTIYHGTGLVVNDHARIGCGVIVRNGVTIGHQVEGGGCPRIGDGVAIGASALILGDIVVGEGAVIGAGSVVINSVAEYTVVAGNPARKIKDVSRPYSGPKASPK